MAPTLIIIMLIPFSNILGANNFTESGEAHSKTKSTSFNISSKSKTATPPAKLARFSAFSISLSKKYAISIPLFSGTIMVVIILAIGTLALWGIIKFFEFIKGDEGDDYKK